MPPLNGTWVSFYTLPDQVKLCSPLPTAKRACGEVIGWKKAEPVGPSKIPDIALTVRGRSGRTAEISLVRNYVTRHASMKDAIAECDTKP